MDFNRTFFARKEGRELRWRLIDAKGKIVGRLASEIADALSGKDSPHYTPHTDVGDYVVVINADKVVFSGSKFRDKQYVWYTGWMGGQKSLSARDMQKRHPDFIIRHAVKGMLRKNRLARQQLAKLRIYEGKSHPHEAQFARYARAEG